MTAKPVHTASPNRLVGLLEQEPSSPCPISATFPDICTQPLPHSCPRAFAHSVLPPTLSSRGRFCTFLSTGSLRENRGSHLMTLKVLCSKRATGVGRPRAKACFRVSMLRLQSSASLSNLRGRQLRPWHRAGWW